MTKITNSKLKEVSLSTAKRHLFRFWTLNIEFVFIWPNFKIRWCLCLEIFLVQTAPSSSVTIL